MARTKFGSIITDIRGSIGGHVFTNGSSGTFMRTKVKPASRNSDAVSRQRNCMSILANAWRNLTPEQLGTWMSIYSDYTFTNSLGKVYTVSPYALFQALNSPLVIAGLSPVLMLDYPSAKNMNPFFVSVNSNRVATLSSQVVQGPTDVFIIHCSQPFSVGSRVANLHYKIYDCFVGLPVGPTALPLLTAYLQSVYVGRDYQVMIDIRFSDGDIISSPSVKSFVYQINA